MRVRETVAGGGCQRAHDAHSVLITADERRAVGPCAMHTWLTSVAQEEESSTDSYEQLKLFNAIVTGREREWKRTQNTERN
jgi:hypothetical protein